MAILILRVCLGIILDDGVGVGDGFGGMDGAFKCVYIYKMVMSVDEYIMTRWARRVGTFMTTRRGFGEGDVGVCRMGIRSIIVITTSFTPYVLEERSGRLWRR